ncbi:hypothetical protein QEH52_13405 [Coraliomargarita sp. SDUM461003]|uniref:PEP-CTERM protein-sorting domain-containing protein n=1 Tax=Thalassobacterium maritimum TaxID=3041265 RepID=A0ABU1AWI0_9BACT|nr:hypothetical protein [Coraliomargarita sp. SDUM461003]MDQ8208515.1 hypothetical protein [Coraliomargarita sp. SDUM461003]
MKLNIKYLTLLLVSCRIAQASLMTVNITEKSNDLLVSYSGSIDLGTMMPSFPGTFGSNSGGINPGFPSYGSPGYGYQYRIFEQVDGEFGPYTTGNTNDNLAFRPDQSSGDLFSFSYSSSRYISLILPVDYISGSELSGLLIFENRIAPDVNLERGRFEWEFQIEGAVDTQRIVVEASTVSVPEANRVGLILGISSYVIVFRRRYLCKELTIKVHVD